MNKPTIVPILKSIKETNDVKTFHFRYPVPIKPGQFYMIWIPGIDEIPMSVAYINKDVKGITFRTVGDATTALFSKNVGDKIGVRGPYGNGFKLKGKKEKTIKAERAKVKKAKPAKEISDIKSLKIEEAGFSTRTVNALINNKIKTVAGLSRLSDESLNQIKGLGAKGIEEIKAKIAEWGI